MTSSSDTAPHIKCKTNGIQFNKKKKVIKKVLFRNSVKKEACRSYSRVKMSLHALCGNSEATIATITIFLDLFEVCLLMLNSTTIVYNSKPLVAVLSRLSNTT